MSTTTNNKNKVWTSQEQFKRRRKKVTESVKKTALNTIVNQFVSALKAKHM
jgi:hypothetical protein